MRLISLSLLILPSTLPLLEALGQASLDRLLVSLHTSHKALQLADLAGSHVLKPGVELFPYASVQHFSKLLDQIIRLIHLRVQRSKQSKRFVTRANGSTKGERRSAKILRGQLASSQKNFRTESKKRTDWPALGRSASLR